MPGPKKITMAKIQLDLSHTNVPDTIPYLRKITGKMTGNVKFTTLAADPVELDTAVTALKKANTDSNRS